MRGAAGGGDRENRVSAVLRQPQHRGGVGQFGDLRGAVQQRRGHQALAVLPPPGQPAFGLPVGVRDDTAVLVHEVPDVRRDMHQQPDVLGVAARRVVHQVLPDHRAAHPEGVQDRVERQALFGPDLTDPARGAVGRVPELPGLDQ